MKTGGGDSRAAAEGRGGEPVTPWIWVNGLQNQDDTFLLLGHSAGGTVPGCPLRPLRGPCPPSPGLRAQTPGCARRGAGIHATRSLGGKGFRGLCACTVTCSCQVQAGGGAGRGGRMGYRVNKATCRPRTPQRGWMCMDVDPTPPSGTTGWSTAPGPHFCTLGSGRFSRWMTMWAW